MPPGMCAVPATMIHNTKIVPPLVPMRIPLGQGTGHPRDATAHTRKRHPVMSDPLADLLRSLRTTTQEDVDRRTARKDRQHMSATDRFDMITHQTPQGGSEH